MVSCGFASDEPQASVDIWPKRRSDREFTCVPQSWYRASDPSHRCLTPRRKHASSAESLRRRRGVALDGDCEAGWDGEEDLFDFGVLAQ